jgi:RND family efflux transporter MFP subunit
MVIVKSSGAKTMVSNLKQNLLWPGSMILALTMLSCGGPSKPGEAKLEHPVVSGVTVGAVQLQSIPNYIEATGTVHSANTSMVATKVMGTVLEVHAKEGDRVKAGQLLIVLDDRDQAPQLSKARAGSAEVGQALAEVEQAIRAADANRQFATATYNRFKDLFEKQSVSRQEMDEVEAKYKGAEAMYQSMLAKKEQVRAKSQQVNADIAAAKAFVSYARITAPQDGIITQRMVDVGTMATPGMPLIVVEDARLYRLEAGVGEEIALSIRIGNDVLVDLPAVSPTPIRAKISEIVPTSDPMTRTSTIKIDLPSNPSLRSGMFGIVRIAQGNKSGIFLPKQAVQQRGELNYVMVVGTDNIAQMRLVKSVPSTDSKIEILSGLNSGERVILEGAERVVEGSRIQ